MIGCLLAVYFCRQCVGCSPIIRIRGFLVGGMLDPGQGGFPFFRVLAVLEDHFGIFVHQGQVVLALVGLGIVDDSGAEFWPVLAVVVIDLRLGKGPVGLNVRVTGLDLLLDGSPVGVLATRGLFGGFDDGVDNDFVDGVEGMFVLGAGSGSREQERNGKRFEHVNYLKCKMKKVR